jgi:tetratricopeptide (TPR) repeat protein
MGAAEMPQSTWGDADMKRLTRALIALAAILTWATIASAQSGHVNGQVLDKDGKPWPGITVVMKSESGRTYTYKTDKDGKFTQLGLTVGLYTVTVSDSSGLNYSQQNQVQSDIDTNITINFKTLMEQGKAAPSAEQQKAQQESQNKFKEMQTHFNAGRAALDDYDATKKQLATTPADQRQPLQDKMDTDAKTAVSELAMAEQGVQAKDTKNHAVVWSNLAQAYEKAGQTQEAVDAYQKAIDLQPSAGIYQNQSTSLAALAVAQTDPKAQADKLAQANSDCDQAAKLDPNPAAALACWKNIGIILTGKSDFKDAVPPLLKATQLNPKDVQAWFLLGSAYTGLIMPNQQGDKITYEIPPGTTDAYQKVIDLDPNGPYAVQAKQNLDALAAMAGGDATAVGVRPKKKKS